MDCLKINFYSENKLPRISFGEEQIDQRLTGFNSRYTFSAKEKDIETGYSYFGARYYTSDLSIWLSVDPMSDKYPTLTPYNYGTNNPLILVDPKGEEKLIWIDNKKASDKTIISGANKYKDDGAIHIFAHGSSKAMFAVIKWKDQKITNGKQLDNLLSQYSDVWKNRKEGDNSFAKRVSEDLENVTVIAPDQRDYYNSEGEMGTYKAEYADENNEYKRDSNGKIKSNKNSDTPGNWRGFKNGKEIRSYRGDWQPKEKPTLWDRLWNQNN